MAIQDIIKRRRVELNLTYEEVGKIVGVSKSTVRKWETGMIENMRQDKIVLLAKALKVSPGYLMGWEEDNNINDSNDNEIKVIAAHALDDLDDEQIKKVIEFAKFIKASEGK